jgi:hypothetical protein
VVWQTKIRNFDGMEMIRNKRIRKENGDTWGQTIFASQELRPDFPILHISP